MPTKETEKTANGTSALKVWDTQYCAPSEAFTLFREGVCNTFMPWSPEQAKGRPFEARIEGALLENGSAAHAVMTPLVALRTKGNVAASPVRGIYGNYVLSGEVQVEQYGRTSVARPGDLILYDTAAPLTMTQRGAHHYEDVSLLFLGDGLEKTVGEDHFNNVLISQDRLIRPLASCLAYLAANMGTSSPEELQSVFDACIDLLPLAAGSFTRRVRGEAPAPASRLFKEILDFVNRNIADLDLSPGRAAQHCGISARYVHKLFAVSGTTFGAYVVAKRLEHIRGDLLSPSCDQPISILAYRWGFNDLSTFNRAFKTKFRCTPSQFRGKFGG